MEKISKNCFKGEVITNPNDIQRLALEKKSIYYVNWGIKPAAIYMSMQFIIIMRLINNGKLFFVNKINCNHGKIG
jgi:hypothetical protein